MTRKTSARTKAFKPTPPALTRAVLQKLSDGIVVIDKGNQVLFANDAACKISDQEQLVGKHLTATLQIAPPPNNKTDSLAHPILFRIPNSDRNGTATFLNIKSLPGLQRLHRKGKTIVILQAPNLNDRSTPVTAYQQILGHLTLRIAHDFNNALSSILGNAEYLRDTITAVHNDESSLPTDALSVAHDIIRKCLETAKTIDKLQDYARQQPRATETIDLNQAITQIIPIGQQALGNRITLEFLPTENLPQFYGEQTQIDQIIISLLLSSRDTMPEGGRVTIQTEVAELNQQYAETHPGAIPGTYLRITVTDTGAGIPKTSLPQTFELFRSQHNQQSGLRLPTAYAIVKQLSGYIDVESWEGQGTKFDIYLPLYSEDTSDQQSSAKSVRRNNRPGPRTRRSRRRAEQKTPLILIAEDQADVAQTMSNHLTKADYRTKVVSNGKEALRIFKELSTQNDRPTMVISDLGLPGIDGKTLCKQIQQLSQRTHLLLTTGYKIDLKEGNTKTLDGFNFLQKPFESNTLIAAVNKILANGGVGSHS